MTAAITVADATAGDLARIAGYLTLDLRVGDVIALEGDLGAGKTTFARAFIRALAGAPDLDIPSPTFAILQSYHSARLTVHHFDFYRLSGPEEAPEIGFDDALADGVSLIEWPARVGDLLPGERLEIAIAPGHRPETRRLELVGRGAWRGRIGRLDAVLGFVARAGWGRAGATYLQGDASSRRYGRLADGDRTAILMDAPRTPDGPAIRLGRSYSAIAHLAEDVRPFVAVADALRARGLSAPEIYAADIERGLLLIEDFGDRSFAGEISRAGDPQVLYRPAVDVLVHLSDNPPGDALALPDGGHYALPVYDLEAQLIEVELLLDWYWPALGRPPAEPDIVAEFRTLWCNLVGADRSDDGWVLRDYHSPNLIWRDAGDGLGQIGLLDFQDAVRGPLAYDLVSLLQDARLDVPGEREARWLNYYCERRAGHDATFDRQVFERSYRICGAQRATKILGIFARLAVRDGKPGYLRHLRRVWGYLERDLAHPALAPLRVWYDSHFPAPDRDPDWLAALASPKDRPR